MIKSVVKLATAAVFLCHGQCDVHAHTKVHLNIFVHLSTASAMPYPYALYVTLLRKARSRTRVILLQHCWICHTVWTSPQPHPALDPYTSKRTGS